MTSQKRTMIGLVMAVGALAVGTSTARANATLDFSLGVTGAGGGTLSYAGGTAPLVGTNIPIGSVTGTGTSNDGTLATTGSCAGSRACLSFSIGPGSGSGGSYSFGPSAGSFFRITGGISSLGLPDTTVLLDATGVTVLANPVNSFTSVQFAFAVIPNVPDTKNATLVSHFFGSTVPTWTFFGNVSGGCAPSTTGCVTSTSFSIVPTSVDINNSAAVPEPMSVLLLGSTMVGIATILRRRKKNSANL